LILSAAASIAASLLMPKERTTPDFAPKPVILIVFSCAIAPPAVNPVASASDTANAIFLMRLLLVWTVW
jgi:hypothetical protein